MTLKQVQQALKDDFGLEVSYDWLSDFVRRDDISEQLRITGANNARNVDESVVVVIAEFVKVFRQVKAKMPQAADLLRGTIRRMQAGAVGESGGLVPMPAMEKGANELASLPAFAAAMTEGVKGLQDAVRVLEQIHTQGQEVFTQREAAAFLKMSVSSFRKYGPAPFRKEGGKRWKRSDLLGEPSGVGE